jgi:predicted amidohydrolase YtcJ
MRISNHIARTTRRLAASAVAACLAALSVADACAQNLPSLLIVNGQIYTADSSQPVAQAVHIQHGRIAAVGPTSRILEQASAGTPVIDLYGKTVVPGFIDAHGHLQNLGRSLQQIDLTGLDAFESVVDAVAARARETAPGTWILGRGWDQNRWPGGEFPVHNALSEASPDHPVYLVRVDGHAALVNAAALRLAGISNDTPDPQGGRIHRDAEGFPTGVLIDRARGLVSRLIPPPGETERIRAHQLAVRECLQFGITTVHDAGVDGETLDLYTRLADEGRLGLRVYALIAGNDRATVQRYFESGPVIGRGDGFLTVRSVKLMSDGALGSRGAALLEPYADDPGNTGLMILGFDAIRTFTVSALEAGFQVSTHAIGDRANRTVLNAYEIAMREVPRKRADARLRIEHAQVLSPADIPRFRELDVIASIQATHATSDMYWAEARLGPERIKGAYAWRKLLKQNARIANGSDFPVESANPLLGFYAAITRQDAAGQPEGGWYPEEVLTRDEALRSFTIDAAFAGFEEKEKGSISPGKWADLVVLSRDIMQIPPAEILETHVEITLIGGRVAYRRPN